MTASYPASIVSFTAKVDNVDRVMASHINGIQDEIVAIETALGVGFNGGNLVNYPCYGRLTLETGVPISTADQSGKTTLYLTPYLGNVISIFNTTTSDWETKKFSETSLSLSGYTASKNYDIFAYLSSGSVTLNSEIWTNDTTRAKALSYQDGVLVKNENKSYRYIGTIRINSSGGQTEDTDKQRFVINYYNAVPRRLRFIDSTDSWTYTTPTWRQMRGQTANKVEFVCPVAEWLVYFDHRQLIGATSIYAAVGIGLDRTNGNDCHNNIIVSGGYAAHAQYYGYPGIGYHYLAPVEYASAATATFFGDNGAAYGIGVAPMGWIMG